MKKKIIYLSGSLFFLLLTIISSTYAFLTINLSAYVTGMEINVEIADGISISSNGLSYGSSLTEAQIREAIVVKYLGYSYSNEGVVVDKAGEIVSDFSKDYIDEKFAEIILKPVTTSDAKTFYYDKYPFNNGNTNYRTCDETDGRYVSFDLYFKALDNKVNVFYSASNYNYDDTGNKVSKFSITGEKITTSTNERNQAYLHSNLTTIDSAGNALVVSAGSSDLTFSPADAMRFSSYVEKYEKTTDSAGNIVYQDSSKIYEINMGLGSYATKLDSSYYDSYYLQASQLDASKNAQETYRINSKSTSLDDINYFDSASSYAGMPLTYKAFDTFESANLLTLDNKDDVKKATFTFWIEGWDADCFDGLISNNISINMAFTTNIATYYEELKTVNYHYGENNELTYTLNYFDINNQMLKDIFIPSYLDENDEVIESYKNKKFKGWYLEGSDTEFDFSVIYDTLVQTFDVYAKWQ